MINSNFHTKDNYSVYIKPNSIIKSYNVLKNCIIDGAEINASNITNSKIGKNASVLYSYLFGSNVESGAKIGVFSHLREGSNIGENVRIGNFVETKKSDIKNGSKVSHLTYVGDAEIGENVNVGCGTVFCNYNGKIKQKTVVGNNVFIGSNSNLVAPLVVEDNSFIAAGSTITQKVPSKCLAIARARQVNKENYLK